MLIDPRTVVLFASVLTLLVALTLFLLGRRYARSTGMNRWAAGPVLMCLGGGFLSARAVMPELPSILLGNGLVLAGGVVMVSGSRQFLARPDGLRRGLLLAVALPGLGLVAGTLWWPSFALRTAIFCTAMGGVMAAHALLLLRHAAPGLGRALAGSAWAAGAAVMLLRLLTTATDWAGGSLFERTLVQVVHVAGLAACVLVALLGHVLLAADRMQDDLEHQVHHDGLTGVLTRRALFSRAGAALEEARRRGMPLAVLMLDLDHFKRINDSHGHAAGDAVLRRAADTVRARLRASDRLGRYGGEEFFVLLPDTGATEACAVAERVRAALQQLHDTQPDACCTASIGIATATPAGTGAGESLEALLARADAALYEAKRAGRNRAVLAPPPAGTA